MVTLPAFQTATRQVSTFSASFSQEVLLVRADRLDRILDRQVFSGLAVHAATIGACLIIATKSVPALSLLFLTCGAFLAIACALFALVSAHRDSLFGGAANFFVAAALTSGRGLVSLLLLMTGLSLAAQLISSAIGRNGRGLGFFPVYAAILLVLTQESWQALVLFLPLFAIRLAFAFRAGAGASSLGSFVGLIIVLGPIVDHNQEGTGSLLAASGITVVGLIIYLARTGGVASDLRNFVNQGVAALVLLMLIWLFGADEEALSLWLWSMALTALLSLAFLANRRSGLATGLAWICMSLVLPVWAATGNSESTLAFGLRLGATLLLAKIVDVAARKLQSPFAANIGLSMMLLAVAIAAIHAHPSWFDSAARASGPVEGFAFLLASLGGVVVNYAPVSVQTPTPWWRGFVRPRHALFVRSAYRASVQWTTDVPWIGSVFKLTAKLFGMLRYLKSGGSTLRWADLVVIIALVIVAFAALELVRPMLATVAFPVAGKEKMGTAAWLGEPIVASLCMILLYVLGLLLRQSLFFFVGIIFTFWPIVYYLWVNGRESDFGRVGVLAMILGIVILFCSLMRTLVTMAPKLLSRRRGNRDSGPIKRLNPSVQS